MFNMKLPGRVTATVSLACLLCLISLILKGIYKRPVTVITKEIKKIKPKNDIHDSRLPKDIKLMEWESLYSRHLDLRRNQHATSTCSFKAYDVNMQQFLSKSNMTDWSFKQKIPCPKINFTNYPSERAALKITCTKNAANVYTVNTTIASNATQIPFGDMCLADVIENCCTMKNDTVPNVVHYVFCGKQDLGFFQFLSYMSVVRFIRPCMIMFHGDTLPSGHYWNYFISIYSNVVHVKRDCLFGGTGHRLGFFEHGTDIMRIEALLVYGGIYLDWDEIILQPIDDLRKHDYVQGYEQNDKKKTLLGSQFIMAKRNATFLQQWYKSYSNDYRRDSWVHNALVVSAKLAEKYPDLIYVGKYHFSRPSWWDRRLIYSANYNWNLNYGMHLYLRAYKKYTDENVIRKLNTTIGAISRHVLFGNKELCL